MSTLNLVGHFLKQNGFHETFKKLEQEHGKPINTSLEDIPNKEPLDDIIQDRFNFNSLQQSLSEIEDPVKTDHGGLLKHWKSPYPSKLHHETYFNEVIVSVEYMASNKWIVMSTAKQKLVIMDLSGEIVRVFDQLIGRVVIKKVLGDENNLYVAGMDGMLYKFTIEEGTQLQKSAQVSVHRRLVIDMRRVVVNNRTYIITIGFDKLIRVVSDDLQIIDTFELGNVPTCFDAIVQDNKVLVLVGYNESTVLELVKWESRFQALYKISINDAEFITSNFSPREIHFAIENTTIMAAISTSHEPYMRCIIIPITSTEPEQTPIKRNQILRNVLTMSPQDKFSNPTISWRAHNQGIWVLGDDGKVRGIDLVTQSIIEMECHESKVKYILTVEDGIVTIGDDRKIKVWEQ